MNWKGKHVLVTGGTSFRVAANRLAKEIIGWEPRVPFCESIVKTIDWYVNNRNPDEVRSQLQSMLTER